MGDYGVFVGLPDPAARLHLTPLSPATPGLDPRAYFHEISRLWKAGNEEVFPGQKEGYALCLFEAPANTRGSTCVLGSQRISGGTFRYIQIQRGGETTSPSHTLRNSIHGIKTRSEQEKCTGKGLYLAGSELSSRAGSSAQLAGDPAHLEFRLWLMTQQIEPVIFRRDVSCHFGPRKQPPPSETAVSQWCSLFSPLSPPEERRGQRLWEWQWGLITLHPTTSASHRAHEAGPASSWRATARRSAHPEDPSSPHKLAGSCKSMRNNFSLNSMGAGLPAGLHQAGLAAQEGHGKTSLPKTLG